MAKGLGKVFNRNIVLAEGCGVWVGDTQVITGTGAVTADIQATAGSITRNELSTEAGVKTVQVVTATQATTGAVYIDVIAPATGTLSGVTFNGVDALAAHDTNYITWTVVNRGQSGGGSTAMIAATDANTTKATGGTALSANTNRSLTLHGTAENLAVTEGDIIRVTTTASGTLANTVTIPKYMLKFAGTT